MLPGEGGEAKDTVSRARYVPRESDRGFEIAPLTMSGESLSDM
jgi:hypothetical protein